MKVADWLIRLTNHQKNCGFGLCYLFLRNVKGFGWNHKRVIRVRNQIIEWRGKPQKIRCDNGPEYNSHTLKQWAGQRAIRIEFIEPGNPQQNAYIERYNRTVRYDWLGQHLFDSLEEARDFATRWLSALLLRAVKNGGVTSMQITQTNPSFSVQLSSWCHH